MEERRIFGLIGSNIGHSFSRGYFAKKFKSLGLAYEYLNFDIADISDFPKIIAENPGLRGLNVTIPYKEAVMQYLDSVSDNAKAIGAVNTIKITDDRKLEGHNTDWLGFKLSLEAMSEPQQRKALILGTGGAAKAVAFALDEMGIEYRFVSRQACKGAILYESVNKDLLDEFKVVINTTPLGTFPNVAGFPNLPYQYFSKWHFAYDLIYNPEETEFLKRARLHGATTKNGFEMLEIQAEKSWEIWTSGD